MIKYFCDGCGNEVTEKDREANSLRILNWRAHVIDEMILCKSCNKAVIDSIKKLTSFRDQ